MNNPLSSFGQSQTAQMSYASGDLDQQRKKFLLMMGGVIVLIIIILLYLFLSTGSDPTKTQLVNAEATEQVMLNLVQSHGSQLTDQQTENLSQELNLTMTSDNSALGQELHKIYDVKSITNSETQAVTNPDAGGLLTNAQSDSTVNSTYSTLMTKYLASLDQYLASAQKTAKGTGLRTLIAKQEKDATLLYDAFSKDNPSD